MFDARLIPEFEGKKGDSVSEWFNKLTWICRLHEVKNLEAVIPLRLVGHAYKIYDQLLEDEKLDVNKIKAALYKAFEVDSFSAYEELTGRRLRADEPVDSYLADVRRLAGLAGGFDEKAIASAFVFGLPDRVRCLLRTNARMSDMSVTQLVECARAILAEDSAVTAAAREVPRRDQLSKRPDGDDKTQPERLPVCFSCGQQGHFARGCGVRTNTASRFHRKIETMRCFRCGNVGHKAPVCPENEVGGEKQASVSSRQ